MSTLYLVRHTEYDNPENIYPFHLPLHLSEEGRAHAKRVGMWFYNNSISYPIISSPIVRAVQTAEIISSKIDSSVSVRQGLEETRHLSLQGKVIHNKKEWTNQRKFPGRETQENQMDRVRAIIYELVNRNTYAILVSHGDPLSITFASLCGKPIDPSKITTEDYIKKGEIVKLDFEQNNLSSYRRIIV